MCRTIGTKRVKLRKAHKCFGCCGVFLKGVQMMTHKTIGDNRIYTLYLCSKCEKVAWPYGECYWEGDLKELWN